MGVGEVIGAMFVFVCALLLCLEWLSKAKSVETEEPQTETRRVIRYRARR